VYRAAQLALLSGVERALGVNVAAEDRLAYLREIDQGLAQRDHRGLKYPPSMLVSAIAMRLLGLPIRVAIQEGIRGRSKLSVDVTQRIVDEFQKNLTARSKLREGVKDGLISLKALGVPVVVLTEGPKERVEKTARLHNLEGQIDIVISAEKTKSLFARVATMRSSTVNWAIGDQIEKDVLPAIAVGYRAFYYPGSFRPSWAPEEQGLPVEFETVSSYIQAVERACGAYADPQAVKKRIERER
jgi:putative hydrolase of the HAD superfamily